MTVNLNGKQIFLIVGAIVSVLMVAGPQLTDLFGAGVAKNIASTAGLINLMINGVMVALTGTVSQDTQVRQVLAAGGIDRIEVNKDASPALAKLAMDPNMNNIAPAAGAMRQVEAAAAKVA